MPILYECDHCHIIFRTAPSRRKYMHVFCSDACYHNFTWPDRTEMVLCPVCNRSFKRFPSQKRRKRNTFCSEQCARLRRPRLSIEARFWPKVDRAAGPSACWIWLGSKGQFGYGHFFLGGSRHDGTLRYVSSHRLAYELTYGLLLPGFQVCHNCPIGDNPTCCNPSHMFVGTQSMNMQDAVAKGRQVLGERHHATTLTSLQVQEIRSLYGTVSMHEMARLYHVSPSTIWAICHRTLWRHIA